MLDSDQVSAALKQPAGRPRGEGSRADVVPLVDAAEHGTGPVAGHLQTVLHVSDGVIGQPDRALLVALADQLDEPGGGGVALDPDGGELGAPSPAAWKAAMMAGIAPA